MPSPIRIVLREDQMPRQWYNIQADLPTPMQPSLHPGTGKPIQAEDLAPIFPMNLIEQEVSTERWIDIPEPVLEKLALWRPSPLHRAVALEKALDTPARIYYKNEGVSPPGSHKPNTAVAQAYYNKVFGIKRLTTETGAGQWGSALAFACSLFGLECKVYMVRISFDQKPFRKLMMQAWGAECVASPSPNTERRPRRAGQVAGHPGQPRHRHQRGRRGGRRQQGHALRPRQRAQPRPAPPDRHRPGGAGADEAGGRLPGRGHRLRRRRVQLRRHLVPLHPRTRSTARRSASWPPSRPPAPRSPAGRSPTTSATRP